MDLPVTLELGVSTRLTVNCLARPLRRGSAVGVVGAGRGRSALPHRAHRGPRRPGPHSGGGNGQMVVGHGLGLGGGGCWGKNPSHLSLLDYLFSPSPPRGPYKGRITTAGQHRPFAGTWWTGVRAVRRPSARDGTQQGPHPPGICRSRERETSSDYM